ncbi:MAG TPA: phosphoenolpyruvate carboxykinase, partial [Dongiaceae bacterium]|nr:phosphoenolpyruvate carboxykinase [Dongiaceae bacterium]
MTKDSLGKASTSNKAVLSWVAEMESLCRPSQVYWCDGSRAEAEALKAQAVKTGLLIKLDRKKRPGCYYHRSRPNDVARVEQSTFICTRDQE